MTSNNVSRFTPTVDQVLRHAGWSPGRVLDESRVAQWYVMRWPYEVGFYRIFPSALRVLREFGDLLVEQDGPGITCSRSTFCINPITALGNNDDQWLFWEWAVEESLFPIGVFVDQNEIIAIGTSGRVYHISERIGVSGHTIEQALEAMILGISSTEIINLADNQSKMQDAVRVDEAVSRLYSPTGQANSQLKIPD